MELEKFHRNKGLLIYYIEYLASSYDRITETEGNWEKLTWIQQAYLCSGFGNAVAELSRRWTEEGELEKVILEMQEKQI